MNRYILIVIAIYFFLQDKCCLSEECIVLHSKGTIERNVGPFSSEYVYDANTIEKYIEYIKNNPNRYDSAQNMGFSIADWEKYLKNIMTFETMGYKMKSNMIANIKIRSSKIIGFYCEYFQNAVDLNDQNVKQFKNPNHYLFRDGIVQVLYTANDLSYEYKEYSDATLYNLPEVFRFLCDYYDALEYSLNPDKYGFEFFISDQLTLFGPASYIIYNKLFDMWKPIFMQFYSSRQEEDRTSNLNDTAINVISYAPIDRVMIFSYESNGNKTSLIPNSILHIQKNETVIEKILLEICEITEDNTDKYFQLPEDKLKSIQN
jgi:hypothetical protein